MNATQSIKRRQFLRQTTGTLGLIATAQAFPSQNAHGADAPAGSADLAMLEKHILKTEPESPDYLRIPLEDGRLVNLVARMSRARNILEIGSSHGYFTLWLAAAMVETGGKITGIEILQDRIEFAQKNLKDAGLDKKADLQFGDAHEVIPKLATVFDLAFLHADRSGYEDYLEKLHPKLIRPGGIILVYNAIKHKTDLKKYQDTLAAHPGFDTQLLSATLKDGFLLSMRKIGK